MALRLIGRHPAALQFVRRELPALSDVPAETGTVDPGSVAPDDVLIGVVPMALAARAAGAIVIEFAGAPPRGAEWDLAAMDAAGAHLVGYRVTPVAVEDLMPPKEVEMTKDGRWEVCVLALDHPPTLRGEGLARFGRWADAKRYARQHAHDRYYGTAIYDHALHVLDTGDAWIDEHGAEVPAPDYATE